MQIGFHLGLLIIGYLIGSISFTRIIGNIVIPDEDLETTTSKIPDSDIKFTFKSVSATTLRVRAGPKYGIIASLLDMAKAAIPMIIVIRIYNSHTFSFLISLGVIIGHDFPIFYNFKGGSGVSPLWGSLFVMNWQSIPVTAFASMLIGLFIIDDAFIAYLSTPFYLIPWALIYYGLSQWLIYAVIVNIIYWFALIPEFREYLEFRKTDKYLLAKEIRHEKQKKTMEKIRNKLKKLIKQ
jgi:glycerol-3-phosphate acyltransferase PlsY